MTTFEGINYGKNTTNYGKNTTNYGNFTTIYGKNTTNYGKNTTIGDYCPKNSVYGKIGHGKIK